jgi:hypothetical protein
MADWKVSLSGVRASGDEIQALAETHRCAWLSLTAAREVSVPSVTEATTLESTA